MKQNKDKSRWTAVYTRVSSDGQKDDSQDKALRDYIEAHGLGYVRWYRDKVSGKDLDRPAMKALQGDVFGGKVAAVLVYRLDRLARNLRDGINLLADLCQRGVRVVSLCEQLDLNGSVGQLIASVLFGVAQMERESINERIRAGIAARKAKGLPTGRKPGQRPRWNPAKRKVDPALTRSLRGQGVGVKDIAAKFGCSRAAVYSALKENTGVSK
jgi:DNA invertase Pin-like site-specific DNA recombinase